jgi:uncharacterized protein with HEPN domain
MRDDLNLLHEIIEQIELIELSMSKGNFDIDKDTQDANIRRLEIIGEAVKSVSSALKKKYVDIEWKKIAGLRDVLIHNYFGVDIVAVKQVLVIDIPSLKKKVQVIRATESKTLQDKVKTYAFKTKKLPQTKTVRARKVKRT